MANRSTMQVWVEAGYELFAREGLESIQVERLARILQLNKSGFYHYFGDRESYLHRLVQKHLESTQAVREDLKQIQQFDPQFMEVLIKHTVHVMAHNQMVRNRHHPILIQTYHQVNSIVDPVVITLFADFIGFQNHLEFSAKYYSQVRDMFYAQISFDRMHYPFLRDFMYQAREVIQHAAAISSRQMLRSAPSGLFSF